MRCLIYLIYVYEVYRCIRDMHVRGIQVYVYVHIKYEYTCTRYTGVYVICMYTVYRKWAVREVPYILDIRVYVICMYEVCRP